MVGIPELWLPILLSAVIVFVASSIIHMVLPYHKGDYRKIPQEEKFAEAVRPMGLAPGTYHIPHCDSQKEMKSPEFQEKMKQGPNALLIVFPNGLPNMAKYLGTWFVYCLVVSFFVAYLTGRTLAPGAHYMAVFRVAGTAAFLGYAMAHAHNSIWRGERWGTTLKFYVDGLVYGLLTAGTFGWLWPR